MARNDGVDRLVVRNANLKDGDVGNTEKHNERKKESYSNPDIVQERTGLNVHYKECEGSYRKAFDAMVSEGTISTRGLRADAKKYGELVFDVNSAYFHNHGGYEYAKQFYADAYKAAVRIVGGEQYILSAVMHADEKNRAMSEALGQDVWHYHLHVVYVPVVEKQILWTKRCKDPALVGTVKETVMQVSSSKKWQSKPALDAAGAPVPGPDGKPKLIKSYSLLQDDAIRLMRSMGYDDIERGQRGSGEEHLSVTQFKVMKERERLTELEDRKGQLESFLIDLEADVKETEAEIKNLDQTLEKKQAKLDKIAPVLKDVRAVAAEFDGSAEEVLPQAGPLESAKAYRENKAKPLFEKVLKMLRSVRRAYLDLKEKYRDLVGKYNQLSERSRRLETRADELIDENRTLKEQVSDYGRVRRMIGPEKTDELVRQSKMIEQRERELVRSRRYSRTAQER